VYACERVRIGERETAGELRERLVAAGTRLLVDHLPEVPTTEPVPQAGETTYAEKLEIDEFRLDPTRGAVELDRLVRAGKPRPGAWGTVDGQRLKVLRAHPVAGTTAPAEDVVGRIDHDAVLTTADGALALEEVQPAGKRAMPASSWRRGLRGDDVRLDRP
jgi:methionyl-tRNA formyltransferase